MEHISKVLGNLDRGEATQTQKTFEERVPTLKEKREELRKSRGISNLENTFENFKPVAGTGKALAAFKALASGKTKWKMLLCYGGVGNGKTHLCESTVIELYKRGTFCLVKTMTFIMRSLKEAMGREAMTPYDVLLERLCRTRHLIIDDVGMGGSGSEWEYGQLEEIVVFRYRENLFTILTTNRDISELPERITSRFLDPDVGRVVLNRGNDYRRRCS